MSPLLGEATHGTHEFYRERARITQRLITEKGFNAVAIEGDWPSAFRVNRYVRAASDDPSAVSALGDFARFPTWMWRNTDVVEFVDWLRDHNDSLPAGAARRVLRPRAHRALGNRRGAGNLSRRRLSAPAGRWSG